MFDVLTLLCCLLQCFTERQYIYFFIFKHISLHCSWKMCNGLNRLRQHVHSVSLSLALHPTIHSPAARRRWVWGGVKAGQGMKVIARKCHTIPYWPPGFLFSPQRRGDSGWPSGPRAWCRRPPRREWAAGEGGGVQWEQRASQSVELSLPLTLLDRSLISHTKLNVEAQQRP